MSNDIRIERLSGAADLDAVAALEAASFTNPWTRESLERELARSPVARVYVLRLPGCTVAAFCSCWVIYDELHINTIAVEPGLRRRGLAMELMRHVLAETAAEGVERAFLEVRASNVPARALYERLGFVTAGVRRRYYAEPEEDAVVLVRQQLPERGDSTPDSRRR